SPVARCATRQCRNRSRRTRRRNRASAFLTLAESPIGRLLFPSSTLSARPLGMNRTALVIALFIGVGVGVVFALYPQLDIAISRFFFSEPYRVFPVQYSLIARHLRDIFTYIIAALAAPAFIAVAL